jgi:hypothetical protein
MRKQDVMLPARIPVYSHADFFAGAGEAISFPRSTPALCHTHPHSQRTESPQSELSQECLADSSRSHPHRFSPTLICADLFRCSGMVGKVVSAVNRPSRRTGEPTGRRRLRLREEPILNFGKPQGCAAIRIVVSNVIVPRAYGITTHQSSIERLQSLGPRSHIRHSGSGHKS